MAAFILHLHKVEREEYPDLSSCFYKGTNAIKRIPLSWPPLMLITSKKAHLLIASHWELEPKHMNLERHKQSVHNNYHRKKYIEESEFKSSLKGASWFGTKGGSWGFPVEQKKFHRTSVKNTRLFYECVCSHTKTTTFCKPQYD